MVAKLIVSNLESAVQASQRRFCQFPFEQRLESHPWFEVGRALDSEAARDYLVVLRKRTKRQPHPYCIYVHVPFCASICRFCVLYTRAVQINAAAVFNQYIDWVQQSIETHPNAYATHGPTTVHFGGGTPLHIGLERFATLTHALKRVFGNPDSCEWALETTTSSLNPAVVEALAGLGFQRIHLGIQTLDNRLRQQYRRHESGEAAIEKIHCLQQQSFLCSVDLIIGFKDSTEAILRDDLQRLYDAGIRMFSICELRQRRRKELTARQHQEQSQRNYHFWRVIWQFMESARLIPIHLGQFASSQESNLYYTHPARGEDCVAIGPYAHGSAGQLYYNNKLLPDYYVAIQAGASPIEKAVLYDDQLEAILGLERELLTHRVLSQTLNKLACVYPESFPGMLEFWQAHGLLLPAEDGVSWIVSREGSWFIGNMIMQVRQLAEHYDAISEKWSRYGERL
jgi:oxygen-independent coproporphyrinogen-3 oxidase